MRVLECDILVVGAGLLGLATADHLLRRGATGVAVAERAGSPNAGRMGEPGPVLRHGSLALAAWEERGRVLLEGWEDYLGTDPGFRRRGSLRIPEDDRVPAECEPVSEADIVARFPGEFSGARKGRFAPRDGAIETLPLLAALQERVRAQGGHWVPHTELLSLDETDDGVRIVTSGRAIRADRVCLTAGVENLRFLEPLGIRHGWTCEVVHAFRLSTPLEEGTTLWLPESRTVLTPLGEGEWEAEIAVDGAPDAETAVDWTRLEAFRRTEAGRIPWLERSEVQRGSALPRLGVAPAETLLTSRLGRVRAAGAFGAHGLGLFPAAAEALAAATLTAPEEGGGILEQE